jgi:hypothetical protein
MRRTASAIKALVLALCFSAQAALGAIAFDAGTVNTSTASASTCNFTHTPVGTPTLALIWVGLDADETISNATYGGTAVTPIAVSGTTAVATDEKMHLYARFNPPSGAQTVDIDYSTDDHHFCLAMTFTGTLTTSKAIVKSEVYDNGGATCTTAAVTLNLVATGNWMVSASVWDGGDTDTFTPTNCTDRQDGATGTSTTADDGYQQCDSTGNSGLRTHTITPTVTDECGMISIEITDTAPAFTPGRKKFYFP